MSEQIKPCPFCGHVGLDFEEGSTFRWILPNCAGCGATRGEVRIQTLGDGTRMEWLDAAKADAIKAWNTRATQPQAPQGAVTPGFRLLPIEPTMEMCMAPVVAVGIGDEEGNVAECNPDECRDIYRAMIAAAPETPEGAKQ